MRNLSNQAIDDVRAVVTWYAADGTFITSDSAFVEFRPIPARQVSPFEVLVRTNPAVASRCEAEFGFFAGGKIPSRDSH